MKDGKLPTETIGKFLLAFFAAPENRNLSNKNKKRFLALLGKFQPRPRKKEL